MENLQLAKIANEVTKECCDRHYTVQSQDIQVDHYQQQTCLTFLVF